MALKKHDFVEIRFVGKIKDGKIFDSNIKEELEKANIKGHPEGFIFPLGEGMFVKGVDEYLIGKDIGKYDIELEPEMAFGKRDTKLIQMIKLKDFAQTGMNPIPGAMFNMDGKIAKVLTVSGGRVMVDFNNPIAGKVVEYSVDVKKLVNDINEKVTAMNDFFFRRKLDFEVKGKKLELKVPKGMKMFIEMFKDKYKEILDLDVEAVEVETQLKK